MPEQRKVLTEHISLREGSENGDLITEDLARGPRDTGSRRVNTINDQLCVNLRVSVCLQKHIHLRTNCVLTSASSDVVDGILENLRGTSSLNDDIETVWVLILELLELNLWVLTAQLNVDIASAELLSKLHLETLGSCDNDMASTVLTEHLRKNKTCRTSTEHKNGGTELGRYLVETVSSAGGGLEEGGINIGEVVDLEDLSSGVGTELGEATIHGDTVCLEMLTEQELTASAVEALIAKLGVAFKG